MDGTPVVVVFFRSPVARPESAVPFILPTVVATVPAVVVTSPVRAGIRAAATVPELKLEAFKAVMFAPLKVGVVLQAGAALALPVPV